MELIDEILLETNYKKRYEKLNNFIATLDLSDTQNILDKLEDKNDVHDFLKIHILKRYQLFHNILEILKGKNIYLINKILEFDFLFKNESPLKTWNSFAIILPDISHCTFIKLLNNLRKHHENTDQVEEYFNAVLKTYSLKKALILLPACSSDFIKTTITKYHLKLTNSDLKKISRKNCELAYWYLNKLDPKLEESKKYKTKLSTYERNIKYLIKNHGADSFVEFFPKHCDQFENLKIGLRTSRKVLDETPETVIEHSKICANILRKETFHKYLNHEKFNKFYAKLYPTNVMEFTLDQTERNWSLLDFVKNLPAETKQKIFFKVFSSVYKKDLEDCQEIFNLNKCLTREFIILLPETQRKTWAEARLKEDSANGKYIALLPTAISIPKLKELLNQTSDVKRRTCFVRDLVETCFINEDLANLATVLTWLAERFRNDDVTLRSKIVDTFEDNYKKLDLQLEHWTPIGELLKVFSINKEYSCYGYKSLLILYINFRLNNNLAIDEEVHQLLKAFDNHYFSEHSLNEYLKAKNFKTCLNLLLEIILKVHPVEADYWNSPPYGISELLNMTLKWNEEHSNDEIPLDKYQYLLDFYLKKLYEENTSVNQNLIFTRKFSHTQFDKAREDFITNKYMSDVTGIRYFLKHDRTKIVSNIHNITNFLISDCYFRYYESVLPKFKTLSCYGLSETIVTDCIQKLHSSDKDTAWIRAIELLCFYVNDTKCLLPLYSDVVSETTVDNDNGKLHDIKVAICTKLFNINPLANFEFLEYFLNDKILLIKVLPSLYSITLKHPRKEAIQFLRSMFENRVSLKKHMIRLLYEIGTYDEQKKIIEGCENETNATIKQVYFQNIFKSVVHEPEQNLFDILMECVKHLTHQDLSCWTLYVDKMSTIPEHLFSDYSQCLWLKLINTEFDDNKFVTERKRNFFSQINEENCLQLPGSFLEEIMEHHLFSRDIPKSLQEAINSLAVVYLNFDKNNADFICSLFLTRVIEPFKESTDFEDEQSLREISSLFFKVLFEQCNMTQTHTSGGVQALLARLSEPLKTVDAIFDIVILAMASLASESNSIELLATKLATLYEDFGEQFGIEIVIMFMKEPTLELLKKCDSVYDSPLVEFVGYLSAISTINTQIMLTILLLNDLSDVDKKMPESISILQKLRKSPFSSVRALAVKHSVILQKKETVPYYGIMRC